MSAQTWRVVLASGEVWEIVVRAGHSVTDGVGYFARFSPDDVAEFAVSPRSAVLRLAVAHYLDVAEVLAPGEPTRAELTAQRDAAWTAGAEAMRCDCAECVHVEALCMTDAVDADPDGHVGATRVAAALDNAAAALRALPIPTRPEVSR